ncbi:hypothetical protein D3C86_1639930 [compost metagenome]
MLVQYIFIIISIIQSKLAREPASGFQSVLIFVYIFKKPFARTAGTGQIIAEIFWIGDAVGRMAETLIEQAMEGLILIQVQHHTIGPYSHCSFRASHHYIVYFL